MDTAPFGQELLRFLLTRVWPETGVQAPRGACLGLANSSAWRRQGWPLKCGAEGKVPSAPPRDVTVPSLLSFPMWYDTVRAHSLSSVQVSCSVVSDSATP